MLRCFVIYLKVIVFAFKVKLLRRTQNTHLFNRQFVDFTKENDPNVKVTTF